MEPEHGRRCTCGGVAPVVSAAHLRGQLPRRLPEGVAWSHACGACGTTFVIRPVASLVLFQAGLAGLSSFLIVEGLRSADRVTGRAVLFGAFALVAWLGNLAWITVDRVRVRRRYPQLKE